MKKILLSVIALFTATIVSAQSLSLVIQNHETGDDVATLNSGDTYDAGSLWDGYYFNNGVYFYVKNNSDKAGTFVYQSWEMVEGDNSVKIGVGVCDGVCEDDLTGLGPYKIDANGEYKGGTPMGIDFTFNGQGAYKYKVNIKFSEDAEPCVFYFKVQLGNPSSINSINSNESNVKFYQNGNNVTMDYAFNEGGNRTLSIVSLSGNVLYTCELDGSNGTLNVPVELASGVYLYTVNGENGTTAHKFVVR